MNEKLTFTGGEPNINFDDLDRNNTANKDALIGALTAYGSNYIIQGVTGDPSITAGYVMLDGEILQVDAHTKSGTHFVKVTTYDAAGDKTFNDLTPRQTWAKHRATITAGSGSLAYSGAKRMPDVLVDAITAGTSILAPANLPKATTVLEGILETSTTAEAQALSSTNKIITPSSLGDVNAGLLTKIVEIGDWNMLSTGGVSVAHALGASRFKNVRKITVVIRDDADAVYSVLGGYDSGSTSMNGGVVTFNSTNINLARDAASFYVATSHDATSYNRGWITIDYIP